MKLVKNPQGEVVAFGGHEGYEPVVPDGYTVEEVETYTPTLTVAERKASKQREIDVLETDDKCGRRYREGFLLSCIKEASAIGLTEEQAYAANPGYRGAKDLNTKITALRAEIRAIV